MNFANYDLAVITDDKQRSYFLGFHSSAGYVVLEKNSTHFVVDSRYFSAAKRILSKKGVNVIKGYGLDFFKEIAQKVSAKTIGIDFTKTTLTEFDALKKTGYDFTDISSEINSLTSVKSETEIKYIAKACNIAEQAWKKTLPFIKEGVTEREVAAELEYNFKKLGASGPSFDTIVAFGKNSAVPHHETGDTKLKKDECVLMDFGCLYKGYCSDMTRTMFYGEPSQKFLEVYLAVLTAHNEAGKFIKAGVSGKDADKVARDVLDSLGFGKYFTHSLGHGIGVNIHEYPNLSQKSEWTLEENSVFSNEPGVYLDGKFGVRIEDSCHIANGKYESFMKDDKSLVVLDGTTIKRKKLYKI